MKSFITTLAFVVITIIIAEALLPASSTNKAARMAFALVMLLCVLTLLFGAVQTLDTQDMLGAASETAVQAPDYTPDSNKSYTDFASEVYTRIFENKLNQNDSLETTEEKGETP